MEKKKRNTFRNALVCAVLIISGGVLLAFPDRYVGACYGGICMWAECVLPCLFPFMVITMLLISIGAVNAAAHPFERLTGKLKLPPVAVPLLLMSLCSGYPAGSRMICEYYERGALSADECKKLAPLCSACGPLFAIGTVGLKAFGGGNAGIKLMCACLVSVISTSLIYSLLCKSKPAMPGPVKPQTAKQDALTSAFSGGVAACCTAGGFIAFFNMLAQIFKDLKIFAPLGFTLSPLFGKNCAESLCPGLLEATGGCFALARSGGVFALPLAGFLITFGGASILLQQICYLRRCGVKTGFFTAFKFIQGIVCFALLCLFSLF